MANFYFDVTKTLEFGLNTGIQRVVRRVTLGALAAAGRRGISVVPVIALHGKFHPVTAAGLAALARPLPRSDAATGQRRVSLLRRMIRRWAVGMPHLQMFWQERQTNRRFRREHAALFEQDAIVPSSGDVLILIDLIFGGSPAVAAARGWARRGVPVVAVIYDMIAVTHSQLVTPLVRHSFRRSLLSVTRFASAVLTISRFCADEIMEFTRREGRGQHVGYFYPGADLETSTVADERALPDADIIWEGSEPVYLMVGSIEPRKGHMLVLDAFERLWATGYDAKLVVIGNPGWDVHQFLERCIAHRELNHRLFLAPGASDAQIVDAMRRSTAMIMASQVEGFGLPLVESLATGFPVIAADITVFREIAGDHVAWFDRSDTDSLVDVIRGFPANREGFRDKAQNFRWIDWAASTDHFLDALDVALAGSRAA